MGWMKKKQRLSGVKQTWREDTTTSRFDPDLTSLGCTATPSARSVQSLSAKGLSKYVERHDETTTASTSKASPGTSWLCAVV